MSFAGKPNRDLIPRTRRGDRRLALMDALTRRIADLDAGSIGALYGIEPVYEPGKGVPGLLPGNSLRSNALAQIFTWTSNSNTTSAPWAARASANVPTFRPS